MPVVVVESPAKAKTIKKYLGDNYSVVASFGHVRDLPVGDGSVDPEKDFTIKWEVLKTSSKHIQEIAKALKQDSDLILATDPDREGEAISWHIQEVLKRKKGIKLEGEPKRVVFNSVTEQAVQEAIEEPRKIDMELVEAYLARVSLDYLVGFRLSPVLWRKLPGARSAGRVQSVCVRIIVEREAEIEKYNPQEYWTVAVQFNTPTNEHFSAKLTLLNGKKLAEHGLTCEKDAKNAVNSILNNKFHISSVQTRPKKYQPPPPFMTATLQQEASRKLRMPPRTTMRMAQRLYEAGLITYMRTDAVYMVPDAISKARTEIKKRFGEPYLPKSPRVFKSKAKNAQEAHECIRPTSLHKKFMEIGVSDNDQRQLYDLIWKRTIASQMESAVFLQTQANIQSDDKMIGLRGTGRTTKFDGYQRLYKEGRDEIENGNNADSDDKNKLPLPPLAANTPLNQSDVTPLQHFTKPPPRYSEASLVKKMVELGIGRPSTYSSIISTIQDRGYVQRQSGRLVPLPIGKLLVFFLKLYFGRYVEYEFTANLEQELDHIASGNKQRQQVLNGFWGDFSSAVENALGLSFDEVLNSLSDIVVPLLVPTTDDRPDVRACPNCKTGRLYLRLNKNSSSIRCNNSSECEFQVSLDGFETQIIGNDPETGLKIYLKEGSYGPYLQLGRVNDKKEKPKMAGVPKDIPPESLDLKTALALLNLPKTIGPHPDDGEPILASIGPYGPYLRHNSKYANLKSSSELLEIGMNHAVDILAEASKNSPRRNSTDKIIGPHPQGEDITSGAGRYGPYVKWKRVYASIPKDTGPESITLEEAIQLLEDKISKSKKKPTGRKTKPRKTASKKASPRKSPKKTTATKRTATKKNTSNKKSTKK